MMFNILLLEDEQEQINTYEAVLQADHGKLAHKYKLLKASNVEEAQSKVANNDVNAAIIDLEVPYSSDSASSTKTGKEYLKKILSVKRFPVIVVSGNHNVIDENDTDIPKHLVIKTRYPGVHLDVFEHFEKIESILEITPLFPEAIEEINSEFKEAFWGLWGNWGEMNPYFDGTSTNGEKEKTFLKRYVCNSLIERWMASNLFNKMIYKEFYTYPSVFEHRIHTGDIIKHEDAHWIVMTAPCDLSNGEKKYPEELTLLYCVSEENPMKNDSKAARKKVAEYFTKQEIRHHYLPPWNNEIGPVKVDFKKIKTIPFSDTKQQKDVLAKRVASLSSHFLPYLLQRYGMYVSRIGQADIDVENYINYLLSVAPK